MYIEGNQNQVKEKEKRVFNKMEFLLTYNQSELKALNLDDIRTQIYSCQDVSNDIYERLKTHLSQHGLMIEWSIVLQEYKQQIQRILSAEESKKWFEEYNKQKAINEEKHKAEKAIEDEKRLKNSLDYWMEQHNDYFKKGILFVGNLCYSTYPCCHALQLQYEDEKGETKMQNFGVYNNGRQIKKAINMSLGAKWYEGGGQDSPINHFSKY